MESVWWVFKQLYEKGLVYEGLKVMPFSAKLGTPFPILKLRENYKDVDDPSLTVAFQSLDEAEYSISCLDDNSLDSVPILALMVGPVIEYVKINDHAIKQPLHFGQSPTPAYYKDPEDYAIVAGTSRVKNWKGSAISPI